MARPPIDPPPRPRGATRDARHPGRAAAGGLGRGAAGRGPRLATAALLAALGACSGPEGEAPSPRHVVLISLDTTRADHFGFLGHPWVRTPRLDALAAESVVFTDFLTVVPTTLPSHCSLFTGKYPHSHGTPRNGFMVNRENEMLPEILQRAGFHTAGFAASFALHSRFDFAQGFDHYDERFDVQAGQGGADQNQRSAADVTDAAIEYLEARGVPERLFLFAHYFDPHHPHAAPAPFDTAYDPRGASELPPVDALRGASTLTPTEKGQVARRQMLQYASEVSYMDHHVGRLLDELRQRGILEEAVVVVTSDHGEDFLEHMPGFEHGLNVYQTTMGAVCLIRLPGGELGGTRIQQTVASIDVLPTLLDLLGLEPPPGTEGERVPLRGGAHLMASRARFGQATKPWGRVETDERWTNLFKARFVRRGRMKLIQTPYEGSEELYDVVADPLEQNDLLASPTPEAREAAARLRVALEAWSESGSPLPSLFEPDASEDSLERLRSLGYFGEDDDG